MGPAKLRRIREGLAQLFSRVDSTFLEAQKDPQEFARAVAWELASAGYCTRSEYEESVLPYLLENDDLLELMRRRRMSGGDIEAEKITLFSALPKDVGKQIREARKARGWTQSQLAEAAGTGQPVVSRIERGASLKQPTIELIDRCARALGHQLQVKLVPLAFRPETDRKAAPTKGKRISKRRTAKKTGRQAMRKKG